jgi:hypothetical protein
MLKGGKIMNIRAWNKNRGLLFISALTGIIAAVILLNGTYSYLFAKNIQQKSFTSPEEAVNALVIAVRANNEKEMLAILGQGGKELISSGDEVADRVGRGKFLKAYDEMNRLEKESACKTVLHVGADDWPLPIPIVEKNNMWFFDTKAAKEEILNRRIGRNELNVIEVIHAFVDAQHEFASKDCMGSGKVEFAQKFISTKGKHDGLYWNTKEGEEMSPLGPLVAQASKEGYASKAEGINFAPFHGYYYKILKGQGKHAQGGAYNYIVNGKMILGFALVACPAEYGNSGVMTFVVNQEGIIYQKNLGKNTRRIAEAMKIFDPDKTWKKSE